MQFATPQSAREAMTAALLSDAPEVRVQALLKQGVLQGYDGSAPTMLCGLDRVPRTMLCRWWGFFQRTHLPPRSVRVRFALEENFLRNIVSMQELYRLGPARTTEELERRLLRGLPFAYGDAVRSFAALDPAFAEEPALFDALCQRGGIWSREQLAVTGAELLNEGIPRRKIDGVLDALLRTVSRSPELNTWPVLTALARQMARFLH